MSRKRHEFPKRVKVEAFRRANGKCEGCGAALRPGKFHYDHRIPDALGGEPTLENCQVLCTEICHAEKTAKQDVPAIARAKRIEENLVAGVRSKPRRKIPSPPKAQRAPRDQLPFPDRRPLYQDIA